MRTRWLIDFDGCIVNTVSAILDAINRRFGTALATDQITEISEFWSSLPEGMVKWAWSSDCFDRQAFIDALAPLPDVIDSISALLATECPVVIVTDRPVAHLPWITAWLARHDLIVPVVSSETRDSDKTAFLEEYAITTVVEDSLLASSQFLSAGGDLQKLFLLDMPWNSRAVTVPPVERLSDWTTLLARIHEEHAA